MTPESRPQKFFLLCFPSLRPGVHASGRPRRRACWLPLSVQGRLEALGPGRRRGRPFKAKGLSPSASRRSPVLGRGGPARRNYVCRNPPAPQVLSNVSTRAPMTPNPHSAISDASGLVVSRWSVLAPGRGKEKMKLMPTSPTQNTSVGVERTGG